MCSSDLSAHTFRPRLQDLKSELQERDDEIDAYKQVVGSLRDQVAAMQQDIERLKQATNEDGVAGGSAITSSVPKKKALNAREEELASARHEFDSIVSVLGSPVGKHHRTLPPSYLSKGVPAGCGSPGKLMFERAKEILTWNPSLLQHQCEKSGKSLLHLAVNAKLNNVVELLLANGANPTTRFALFVRAALLGQLESPCP